MASEVFTRQAAGSFAPRLTSDTLANYRKVADRQSDPEVKDHMRSLCKMTEVFLETPDVSGGPRGPFGEPRTPLPQDEIDRIWDHVPWAAECDMIGQVFDRLTDPEDRKAAYHLLWYARELTRDRQPITKDLLPPHLQ